jgi:hypothetical protein
MLILNLWQNVKNHFLKLKKISRARKSIASGKMNTYFWKIAGIFAWAISGFGDSNLPASVLGISVRIIVLLLWPLLPRVLRRRPWSLGRWGRGFESRLKYGCLSSSYCIVLSCVSRGICDKLIIRPKESYLMSKYIKETFRVWGGQGPFKYCPTTEKGEMYRNWKHAYIFEVNLRF